MGKAKTSKFIREYGLTLPGLAKKYDVSTYYLYILHQRGELHQFIEEKEAQEKLEYTKRFISAHPRNG